MFMVMKNRKVPLFRPFENYNPFFKYRIQKHNMTNKRDNIRKATGNTSCTEKNIKTHNVSLNSIKVGKYLEEHKIEDNMISKKQSFQKNKN